jgi:hypothetical protein
MLLVTGIIPCFLLKSLLPRQNYRLLSLFCGAYLFLFWRLGVFAKCQAGASWLSQIVSRAGIIGVTLMAAISGYGSVLTPMQLFLKRKVVSADHLQNYQERFLAASEQLKARRRRTPDQSAGGSWFMKRVNWITGAEDELGDLEMAVDAMNDEYERLKTEQVIAIIAQGM